MYAYSCINFPVMIGDYFVEMYEDNYAGYMLMKYRGIYFDASERKHMGSSSLTLIDNDTFSNRVLTL